MNSINLVGRLTTDPELKQTNSGKSVCTFTLAVSRPRVKDTTDFINCVVWNQSAEYLTSYGHKGNLVAVTGVLTSRKFDDKDGNHRTAFEVVCDSVSLCESKDKGQGGISATPSTKTQNNGIAEPSAQFVDMSNDDELPF
jgi:single-strand DNA-binding protein